VGRPGSMLVDRCKRSGVDVNTVSSTGLRGIFELRNLIRRIRPAVLHAHTSRTHQLARLANVGLRSPVPLVVTRRVSFPMKHSVIARWKYLKGVSQYVAVADAVGRVLQDAGVPANQITTIHSSVDFAEVEAISAVPLELQGASAGGPVVLHAAAFSTEKNQAMLLRAWKDVEAMHDSARLLIAGEGDLEADLRSMAADLGLKRLHWLGFRPDIIGVMKSADLFVMTSDSEGICSVLIQARRAGLPIVATRVGGIPEVVEDGVHGLLVDAGDAASFARAILDVLQLARLEQFRVHAPLDMDRFSVEHMVAAYLRLYDGLTDGSLRQPQRAASGGVTRCWPN
jgi:glycosyltransferase involved in cell wall biosynthesis